MKKVVCGFLLLFVLVACGVANKIVNSEVDTKKSYPLQYTKWVLMDIWAVKRNIHKWEIDKNCKISKNEQVTYKNVKSDLKTKCPKTTIYYCFITIEKVDK